MFGDCRYKAKKTTRKNENPVDEITALLIEEMALKLDTLHSERRAFMKYQKASAELRRLARVLSAYEWADHCAKVAPKEA
jgi:structural maintenance of chromosome 2